MSSPDLFDVVTTSDGQRLFVTEWIGDGPTLVFVHGLSSSHRNAAMLAQAIQGRLRVISLDLRGRGCSATPPAGNYGLERHAADVLEVMSALGVGGAFVAGHSMGAYIATHIAVAAPEVVRGLAMIDGGVRPADELVGEAEAVTLLEATVGPAVARLRTVYERPADYLEVWRNMPYFPAGETAAMTAYALSDLGFDRHGYRSKCAEVAVTEDWLDLLCNPVHVTMIQQVKVPVLAIAAEHGLTADQPPILSEAHLAHLRQAQPQVTTTRIPGTSHHTVAIGAAGARAAAQTLVDFTGVT